MRWYSYSLISTPFGPITYPSRDVVPSGSVFVVVVVVDCSVVVAGVAVGAMVYVCVGWICKLLLCASKWAGRAGLPAALLYIPGTVLLFLPACDDDDSPRKL